MSRGLQRIGRAGHHVGEPSRGRIFPKYRGDLLEAAAVVPAHRSRARRGDALPAQPASTCSRSRSWPPARSTSGTSTRSRRWCGARRRSPTSPTTRSPPSSTCSPGRYPSDEFAGLKPRVVWDRANGRIRARDGAGRVAITNGGTIPDRGLYGVFLPDGHRVGELDEEMVYESRPGDTFVLGASTWRIQEITPAKVIVTPAPGEPARMPFWHGDKPGRPIELGRALGATVRELGQPRARRRRRAAAHAPPPRRVGGRQPRHVPRRPARRHRRAPRRPHRRGRALPRRDRRLAHLRAHAVRRARPRAVGARARGAAARAPRPRGRHPLERRRHRAAPARGDRGHPDRRARDPARRGRGPRDRAAAVHRAVRGALPGGVGPRAAAPPPSARRAHAALACSASRPATCSRSRRATPTSRCCSRPRASACATCSTSLRSARCCTACSPARSAPSPSTRRGRRRSPSRCCSAGSRRTCTRATHRSPSGARSRSRSTATCSASCSAPTSSASSSTPTRSTRSSSSCSGSRPMVDASAASTTCTTCCATSAT